jgi:2-amino-4-hydroxy-6-hydroxymethyldihydropteridine diphosphokinase
MSTKEFGTDRKSEINLTYLSIGSNIGDRIKNLSSSRLAIEKQVGNLVYESKVYETEPWGYKEQGFFLNQVVFVKTYFNPYRLLETCKKIERDMGRSTNGKWRERIIDIDILYFNNSIVKKNNLLIPHKFLHERKFILKPLNDIAPNFLHPKILKTTSNLLNECRDNSTVNAI